MPIQFPDDVVPEQVAAEKDEKRRRERWSRAVWGPGYNHVDFVEVSPVSAPPFVLLPPKKERAP